MPMNLYEAIEAHVAWKQRLIALIDGHDERGLKSIGDDTACELGRWIQKNGELHGDLPAFQRLQDEHIAFHRYAEAVVEAVNTGEPQRANEILNGEYATMSMHIMRTMAKLRRELGEG